jgi:hypothetical protein
VDPVVYPRHDCMAACAFAVVDGARGFIK